MVPFPCAQPGARSQNSIRRSRCWAPRQEGGLAGCFPTRWAPPPPPHAPGLQRLPLPPTPRATSLRSPIPLQKLQKFEETFQDPTVDPSGHLVHWARRKRCALGVTPAPNICPKVPSSGVSKAPLQMCAKGPQCLPSPAWPRAPNVCKSLPNRVPQEPLSKVPRGLKNPPPFANGTPAGLLPKAYQDACQGSARPPPPDVSKSCLQSRPFARSFRYQTMSPLFTKEPFPAVGQAPHALPRVSRPLLCPESFQVVYQRPSPRTKSPPTVSKTDPTSGWPKTPARRFTEALPPRCVPLGVGGGVAGDPPQPRLQSLFKLGSWRPAEQLTTAISLSDLGATSPGNLMMGDGAAAMWPNRQPRTQSARSAPASAPRATSVSIIALLGPVRRPGGRWFWFEVCGRVPAWLAPLRRAALRGTARLRGLALPGAAARGPVPAPPSARLPVLPVPESFCMFKAPDVQPPATPGGSLDAAETREGNRQMWPAGLGGRWQCKEVAVVWGDGAARSGPPLTALFAPLTLFSSFSSSACFPRRLLLLQASSCTISSRPLFPFPRMWARSPATPCGETSGVPLQDLRSEQRFSEGTQACLHSQ